MSGLLTIEGVAEMLAVSTRQVYRLIEERDFPSIRVSERVLRFDESAISAWLAERVQAVAR